jgi:hypothetical protein
MRRSTLAFASGLVAASVVATLVAVVRDPRAPSASNLVDASQASAPEPRPAPSADPRPARPDQTVDLPIPAQDEQPPSSSSSDRDPHRAMPAPSEAEVFAHLRKLATQDVQDGYSLLLEHLDILPQEREELVALLIEMQIEGTSWSSTSPGFEKRARTISEQERHDRIATVIGNRKLASLLALEQNRVAYWETQQITKLLRRHETPLSEAQRDGVFAILVGVRNRYPLAIPAELDRRSLEHLELTLAHLDDVSRHVVELAPSVLSPTQVVHLFDAYQAMSDDRANSVEQQKKRKAGRSPEDLSWSFPALWSNRIP